MPLVNYCKKCKTETPLGESCPYCGGKLIQRNEQLSFGAVRVPVREWFAWNHILRIALPVLLLVLIAAIAAEALAGGLRGVEALLTQGFLWTLFSILCAMLLCILVLLVLQGPEKVHYLLDKQGVHARTYLASPSAVRLHARFLSPMEKPKDDGRPPLEGLTLVRYVFLPWSEIRRVRIWREGCTLLFFRPSFWQAISVRCPAEDLAEAEAYVRRRLKSFQKTKVLPCEKLKRK